MVRPFLNTGFIGLTAILLSIAVYIIYPNQVPSLEYGFHVPVVAFEFIQSSSQVDAFFGVSSGAPETDFVQQSMKYGSYFDYLLLVVYFIFYVTFLLKIRVTHKTFFYIIPVSFALLAMVADGFQNYYIIQINDLLNTGNYLSFIPKLVQASWIKYFSLALVYWMLLHFFMNQEFMGRLIGILGIFPFLFGLIAYIGQNPFIEIFVLSNFVFFVLLVLYCFVYTEQEEL